MFFEELNKCCFFLQTVQLSSYQKSLILGNVGFYHLEGHSDVAHWPAILLSLEFV
jgi:hypothetical protein